VLALQQRLGISYKDASHRLYIAEVEKLKVADEQYKAFDSLDKQITKYLKDLNKRFQPDDADKSDDADDADTPDDADSADNAATTRNAMAAHSVPE
jgi:hypothetical protein